MSFWLFRTLSWGALRSQLEFFDQFFVFLTSRLLAMLTAAASDLLRSRGSNGEGRLELLYKHSIGVGAHGREPN